MIYRPVIVLASACFFACNNPSQPNVIPTTDSAGTEQPAPAPYFPVADYLRNEISYVDSLPVGIRKYTTANNKTDSGYITIEEFHRLSSEFLPPQIDSSNFAAYFEETSFFDRTSGTATFFYKPASDSLPVRRVDVVTAKGNVYDEVRSVYMEKSEKIADSAIVKKLFWKPKRNFQIITQQSTGTGTPQAEQVKVVWDNRE